MSFGKRLKTLRLQLNLTQEDLAAAAGVSTRTVISYEKGDREPQVSKALAFAKCLRVNLSELLTDSS